MDSIVDVQCHFCGKIVERKTMEDDYHKGWHTVGREKIYPYEERIFKFPEGMEHGVVICQDCNDKPTSQWVHQLRIAAVKKEMERANDCLASRERQIKAAESQIKQLNIQYVKLGTYLGELQDNVQYSGSWENTKIPDNLREY